MALNLARLGGIQRRNTEDFNPFAEAEDRRRAAMLQQKATLDLAKAKRDEAEDTRKLKESADARGVLSSYLQARDVADTAPIGVVNPKFLGKPEMGPQPQGYQAPRDTSSIERQAVLDLAKINPETAESFRTGRMAERQGQEDRARTIATEQATQRRLDDAEARAGRKLTDDEKQQVIANNIAWFNARTARTSAENKGNPTLKQIPGTAQTQILENIQNAKKAQKALALVSGKNVGQLEGDTKPTGFWKSLATLGNATGLNKIDPKGAATRAAIADLGSMVIHDRSGAAVTASESPRLMPFIPTSWDSPEIVKTKLKRFLQEYNSIIQDQASQYSEEAGYNPSPLVRQYIKNMPVGVFDNVEQAKAANLPSGSIVIVDGEEVEVD